MSNSNKSLKYQVGAILDFALDTSDMSTDDILEELSNDGIDVDIAINKIMNVVNEDLYENKSWKEIALEKKQLMVRAQTNASESLKDKDSDIANLLRSLIASGELQVQFREFDKMTDEDLLSLLEDVELLRRFNESSKKS